MKENSLGGVFLKNKKNAANRHFTAVTAENGSFRYLPFFGDGQKSYFFVTKNKSYIKNLVVLAWKLAALQLF